MATRSPTPANPASVAGVAPSAIPNRITSARPRVMMAATVFSPSPTPTAIPAGQRDDVLAGPAHLGTDHIGVGVGPEVSGGQGALQGYRAAGVAARDDGGRGLLVSDLAGQVRPGHHRHPGRIGAGHLDDDLAHPHE